MAVAAPTATFHGSVEAMLQRLKLSDGIVVHVRHYGALPELVTRTDLLAIVPQMFAAAVAARYAVRVWELPGHGPHYNVRMMWHQSATNDPAHSWLRERVRQLFLRSFLALQRVNPGFDPRGVPTWVHCTDAFEIQPPH